MKKTITIIDTFGFFFRSFYALPPLKSKSGHPTGLLKGFMDLIYSLGKDYKSDYLLFALDSKGDSFRKDIYDPYKANRQPPPEDLLKQIPIAIEWIDEMGFKNISKSGFEADDIIASIANIAKNKNIEVRIVSHDKDLYQLIDEDIYLFDPQKKVKIKRNYCLDKYGVLPSQFIDYQSLVGDSSDNVPGVKGIGAKTAQKLLTQFKTLDDIYANIDSVMPKGVQAKLKANKELAYISKQLVTLKKDIFSDINLDDFSLPAYNPILKIEEKLNIFDLTQIISRTKKEGLYYSTKEPEVSKGSKKNDFKAILLDTKQKALDVIKTIGSNKVVAFDTETDGLDERVAKIVGFSFCFLNNEAYYIPISHNYLGVTKQISKADAKDILVELFKHQIVGQNLKYDISIILNNFNIQPHNIKADTMILSWLINPSVSASLDNMAKRYFEYDMIKFKDVVTKGQTFANIDIDLAKDYASEDAWMTYKIYYKLIDIIDDELLKLATDMELKFMLVLVDIQNRGIKIDVDFFNKLHLKAKTTITTLVQEIYTLANKEFNINSTSQLAEVLFNDLKLPKGKKTKTGYSTNEAVLNSLRDRHQIIPKLLEYREIFKLNSTYIIPFLNIAAKNNSIIHTSFLQTGTTTGRLSSQKPNLQNIPVKTKLGKEIRYGFVSRDGYRLISIDYSQIELRLLAHFSQDEYLIKAFLNDEDIHLLTAIKIFGQAQAQQNRNIAKSINFGLLYGMGARKLADELNITLNDAKEYIKSYFESFPTVKDYLTNIKEQVKEDGYVKTLLNRKRVFDFDRANQRELAAYDRESVNAKFQGSAADIIKLSMNRLNDEFKNKDAFILLQIHDELIIEAREDIVPAIAQLSKDIMENIYSLKVPLKCSLKIGKNWGEL